MPYIVTTKRPAPALGTSGRMDGEEYMRDHDHGAYRDGPCLGCEREAGERCAVATMEEARDKVLVEILMYAPWDGDATISESGGTVGPLPDGTVIEVVAISDLRYREIEAGAW